jgi:hypothetical protein
MTAPSTADIDFDASNFPTDADADPEQLEMLRALMAGFPSEATCSFTA